jgi:hypothetical protein
VTYIPIKIQTVLGSDTYNFSFFPNYELLKDHICHHVLNPAEMWIQIEPKLDVLEIRKELMSLGCYSHHLGSPQNSHCKWCSYLYDSQCAQIINLPEVTYISSIASILELRNNPHLVVSTSAQEIIFVDSLGIIVICNCTVPPYEYVVKTAFREESKSIVHKLSKEQYFEKANNKVLTKYAQTGKILSLRI